MGDKGTVYLTGKMTGLTLKEMSKWRIKAAAELCSAGFNVLDPVEVFKIEISNNIKPSSREIVDSNKYQIRNSDILLVELNHPEISIGTIGEMVYARELGKVVIVWGTADKVIGHPWVQEHITAAYDDLEDAIDCIVEKYAKVS